MDASTITSSSFTLTPNGGSPVAATVTYDATSHTATLNPSAPLAANTAYTATLTTALKAADGTALAAPVSWSFTTACPCSLYGRTGQPASQGLSVQDSRSRLGPYSYELGTKITVDQPMQLSAISFYKDPQETGAHTGRLWSADGTLLAQVAFTNESGSGWQRQALSSPIELDPNTPYVVSVNANAFFGMTAGGLANAISSGPLHSVADGQNGVFADTAGSFPNQSYSSSSYFVDAEVVTPSGLQPPTVTTRTPIDGATGVGRNSAVSSTFSRAMDATTITGSSFTLTPNGGSPVGATVAYNATTHTATLTPAAPLSADTSYTANLGASVKAADGTPLAAPISWTFSTACPCSLYAASGKPASQGLSVQDGRTGGGPFSYELGTKITVDQPMQLTAVSFYKDPQETGAHVGRVWSADGTQLAQVAFANETVSGWQRQPLATPLALQAGTTYLVSVNANAFFGMTAGGLANAISSGPLHSVADGQNGVFASAAGNFPDQSYNSSSYYVDAEVAANPPAAPAANQTSTRSAVVTRHTPAGGAKAVSTSASPSATFSLPMDAKTITRSSFTLTASDGARVRARVRYDTKTRRATLVAPAPLRNSTSYTVRLSRTIRTAAHVRLRAPVSWRFSTIAAPPKAAARMPAAGATEVDVSRPATITFAEPMRTSTISAASFTLTPLGGRTPVAASVSYDRATNTATLLPSSQLAPGATYVAELDATVRSARGVALPAPMTWSFTTAGDAGVAATSPPGGAADLGAAALPWLPVVGGSNDASVEAPVTARFSGAIDPATLTKSSFALRGPNGQVDATVRYDAATKTATLVPQSPLAYGSLYRSTIGAAVAFADGVALPAPYEWTFVTAPRVPSPVVLATTPARGASGVGTAVAPGATFSARMNPASLTRATFALYRRGRVVPATVSYDRWTRTATLLPASPLVRDAEYTAVLKPVIVSAKGQRLAHGYAWRFRTAAGPEATSP
jgi:hypothetical protein